METLLNEKLRTYCIALKEFVCEDDFGNVDQAKYEQLIASVPFKNKQWAGDAILDTLFDSADERMTDDGDKKILEKLKGLVKSYELCAKDPSSLVHETLFFPNTDNVKSLCRQIEAAKRNLKICVFTITDNKIRDAILNRYEEGIKVQIITDDECMKSEGSDIEYLASKGIEIRTDDSKRNHMHNKFCIIDNNILCTGSFNWTVQAGKRNQENILITDYPFFIHEYREEFKKLWAQFADNEVEPIQYELRGRKKYSRKKARWNNHY
ncbi:unnamed protein product [Moneuplotes crassus]|uniref:Mitochondrial cardiolipin hydrolase n=1 Tax=Euplotes crassus TaxID=5936 RepID=A0AAD1XT40_EUPCR|nr:unnamed protein product [Moneuplotes crassus]